MTDAPKVIHVSSFFLFILNTPKYPQIYLDLQQLNPFGPVSIQAHNILRQHCSGMMALSLPGGVFAPDDSGKPARNGPGKAVLQPPSHRFRIILPLLGLRTHDFLPA